MSEDCIGCGMLNNENVALSKENAKLQEALKKICGFSMSQFMGPHDMALECKHVAILALSKTDE
jgi:hypothetical protein